MRRIPLKPSKLVPAFLPLLLALVVSTGFSSRVAAQAPEQEEPSGARHLCPVKAIRNGVCDPNPDKNKSGLSPATRKKQPQYTRVAKQSTTVAQCNIRVQQTITVKVPTTCRPAPITTSEKEDLPLDSQRVGITIWRLRPARPTYQGARILSHPEPSKPAAEYQAERIQGDPVLAYGEKVRLGIESPRDGYLYVFDRELYQDGSLSAPYMIFPTTRLRDGDNRIKANRPVELPTLTDDPFYFEAKKIGLDPNKRLVGEVLSIAITDKPISRLSDFGRDATQVPLGDMQSLETLYAGRAEVFELEDGVGKPYSKIERDAANNGGARLLTHTDPVPQTFFLVEDKQNGGLLVSIALKYEASNDRARMNGALKNTRTQQTP